MKPEVKPQICVFLYIPPFVCVCMCVVYVCVSQNMQTRFVGLLRLAQATAWFRVSLCRLISPDFEPFLFVDGLHLMPTSTYPVESKPFTCGHQRRSLRISVMYLSAQTRSNICLFFSLVCTVWGIRHVYSSMQ